MKVYGEARETIQFQYSTEDPISETQAEKTQGRIYSKNVIHAILKEGVSLPTSPLASLLKILLGF